MKRLLSIFALVALISGCMGTRSGLPPTAEQRLIQDGKLLYELGRSDEARQRLQLLLAEASDQHLKRNAAYHLDRIERGLPPAKMDPRVPHCSGL